jgi:hypothetical protein
MYPVPETVAQCTRIQRSEGLMPYERCSTCTEGYLRAADAKIVGELREHGVNMTVPMTEIAPNTNRFIAFQCLTHSTHAAQSTVATDHSLMLWADSADVVIARVNITPTIECAFTPGVHELCHVAAGADVCSTHLT